MSDNDNLLDLIFSLEEHIDRIISCSLKERGFQGMALTHGKILIYLHEKSRTKPVCPMNELATQIHRKKNTVTTLVGKLENMGCVETHRSSEDKRVILVEITPRGEQIREVFKEVFDQAEAVCRGKMKGKKVRELQERLNGVLRNLEKKV